MIKSLINNGESKTIEFKESLPKNSQIQKTVCAFANRAGGHIIIGIEDEGEIIGVSDVMAEEYLERIPNIIHDTVSPMIIPEIYTYDVDNKKIVVVQVYPGSTPPYYIKNMGKRKGTYVRVGKTNKQADFELLQELERKRLNKAFDEDICKEINDNEINNLKKIMEEILEKEMDTEKLENLSLIEKIGEIQYVTNAAEIIQGSMENYRIKCARFAGESVVDFVDKKEYSGDVFSQLKATLSFIKNHINMAGIIRGSEIKRRDVPEIPHEVLREAVINAILHRDYSISGSDIKVAVFDTKIEIISPGGLPKTITVEEIYAGRSEIRNKVLAKIFLRAGIIEQWGSGIPRMRELCKQNGLNIPELSEDGLFVKLTIFRQKASERKAGKKEVKASETLKKRSIQEGKEAIYQLILQNGKYTVQELSKIVGLSVASTQRRLDSLQKEKRIVRVGSKKSGKWEISQLNEKNENGYS